MNDTTRLDAARAEVLRRIDREEKNAKRALIAFTITTACVEALGLVGFAFVLDFKDPLHRLLGYVTLFLYVTLALWIVVIWAQIRHSTGRILRAVAAGLPPDDSTPVD